VAPRCGAQMPEFTRGKGGAKGKGKRGAAGGGGGGAGEDEDEEGREGEAEVRGWGDGTWFHGNRRDDWRAREGGTHQDFDRASSGLKLGACLSEKGSRGRHLCFVMGGSEESCVEEERPS
jgi:hypothetical protein